MNNSVILTFFIGQLIVQTVLYFTLARPFINKPLSKYCTKALPTAMVIENLAISVLVMVFTSSGASAGMTNLMASVLLGFIMAIDCKVLMSYKAKQIKQEEDNYFIQTGDKNEKRNDEYPSWY